MPPTDSSKSDALDLSRLTSQRRLSFREFCELHKRSSRLTLLSLAHDYFRVVWRLPPEQFATIKAEINAEDIAEDIPIEDLPSDGRPVGEADDSDEDDQP